MSAGRCEQRIGLSDPRCVCRLTAGHAGPHECHTCFAKWGPGLVWPGTTRAQRDARRKELAAVQ